MSRFASPSLADVITEGIDDRLRSLHTSEPGRILSFNPSTQTARVCPVILRSFLDDEGFIVTEEAPDIFDVPVIFPRTRAGYITFPIEVGDHGLIIYPMRDIGQWRATGQLCDPGDHRVCSMSGAVFIPGLYPDANQLASVSTENVVIGTLGASKIQMGSPSAADYIALSTKLDAVINALATAVPAAGDGGAALQAAVRAAWNPSAPFTSSCAATKVLAE